MKGKVTFQGRKGDPNWLEAAMIRESEENAKRNPKTYHCRVLMRNGRWLIPAEQRPVRHA